MLIDIYRQSVSYYIYYKAVEGLPLDRCGSHFLFYACGINEIKCRWATATIWEYVYNGSFACNIGDERRKLCAWSGLVAQEWELNLRRVKKGLPNNLLDNPSALLLIKWLD